MLCPAAEACVWPGLQITLLNECMLPKACFACRGTAMWPAALARPQHQVQYHSLHSSSTDCCVASQHHSLAIIPVSPFDKATYLHKFLDLIIVCKATGYTTSESQVACKNCNESLALQLSCVSWALLPSVHQMGT